MNDLLKDLKDVSENCNNISLSIEQTKSIVGNPYVKILIDYNIEALERVRKQL